jgi:hypothetical protein
MATEVWTSSAGPTSSPLSSADFAAVIQELHDKLIANGLVATADTGQLDFAALAGGTPALASGAWLGYRIYQLDDGHTLPLYLRIRFGVANGYNTGNRGQFAFGLSFGFGTTGDGSLAGGQSSEFTVGASTSTNSFANHPTAPLVSMVSISEGFVGVSFKQRYFNPNVNYGPSGAASDAPTLLNFALCRTTDDGGNVTSDGATMVLAPGYPIQASYFGGPLRTVHVTAGGVQYSTDRAALVLGGDAISLIGGSAPIYNIFAMTPAPRRIMQVAAVHRAAASAGDLVTTALVGTTPRTYRVIPEVWPADAFSGASTRSCLAMLWE